MNRRPFELRKRTTLTLKLKKSASILTLSYQKLSIAELPGSTVYKTTVIQLCRYMTDNCNIPGLPQTYPIRGWDPK